MATGWRLATSTSNDQIFTDAAEYDAIFRTLSTSQKLLFGASSNVPSTLAVSSSNVSVNGDLLVSSTAYSGSLIVNNNLRVGAIPDIESAIKNISVGGGLNPGAVTSNIIADSNIFARHIADSSILDQHIAVPISVSKGGTGGSNFDSGSIVFGDGSNAFRTHAALNFDSIHEKLSLSNLHVVGSAEIGGVHDLEQTLSNLADGSAILDHSISNQHIADSSILARHIADSSILNQHIAGPISVSKGGTGGSNFDSGSIVFGDGSNAFRTHAALNFDSIHEKLSLSNLEVSGIAKVGGVPDLEQTLSNLADGSAILDRSISNQHIAYSNVFAHHIADSSILNQHIAAPISVSKGGTGGSNFDSGSIVFGDGSNAFRTHAALNFDSIHEKLSLSNLHVVGSAEIGGVRDLEQTLSNLADGSAILDHSISNQHIAYSNVLAHHIADSSILNQHIAAPISVSKGGTGGSNFDSGSIVFGDGSNAFRTHAALNFDSIHEKLSLSNLNVSGIASVGGFSDLEQTLSNLADGSAILDHSISNQHIADSSILARNIADLSILDRHIADPISVSKGGTGGSNFDSGSIVFGDGSNAFRTHAALNFDSIHKKLSLSNLHVVGSAQVGGVRDLEQTLSNLADGSAILDHAISNQHIADSSILARNITDSNIFDRHIAAPISVSKGGTGGSNFDSGSIVFGDGSNAFRTHAALNFDSIHKKLSLSNLKVSGIASVGSITSIEHAINNISVGGGLNPGAVTSNIVADSNILSRHIADSSILDKHIAAPISVSKGGTGDSNFDAGLILFGHDISPLQTDPTFSFDNSLKKLSLSNLHVVGSAEIGGVRDLEQTLSNLADGSAILDHAISNQHIADASILARHITDSSILDKHIAAPISVSNGGTGGSNFPVGAIPFGDATDPLKTTDKLVFYEADSNVATGNYTASNRVHTHADFVIGAPGAQRFRFFIADSNLVVSSIDQNNTEKTYVNFGDIAAVLNNVKVQP